MKKKQTIIFKASFDYLNKERQVGVLGTKNPHKQKKQFGVLNLKVLVLKLKI